MQLRANEMAGSFCEGILWKRRNNWNGLVKKWKTRKFTLVLIDGEYQLQYWDNIKATHRTKGYMTFCNNAGKPVIEHEDVKKKDTDYEAQMSAVAKVSKIDREGLFPFVIICSHTKFHQGKQSDPTAPVSPVSAATQSKAILLVAHSRADRQRWIGALRLMDKVQNNVVPRDMVPASRTRTISMSSKLRFLLYRGVLKD
jgi:hypothetical protein